MALRAQLAGAKAAVIYDDTNFLRGDSLASKYHTTIRAWKYSAVIDGVQYNATDITIPVLGISKVQTDMLVEAISAHPLLDVTFNLTAERQSAQWRHQSCLNRQHKVIFALTLAAIAIFFSIPLRYCLGWKFAPRGSQRWAGGQPIVEGWWPFLEWCSTWCCAAYDGSLFGLPWLKNRRWLLWLAGTTRYDDATSASMAKEFLAKFRSTAVIEYTQSLGARLVALFCCILPVIVVASVELVQNRAKVNRTSRYGNSSSFDDDDDDDDDRSLFGDDDGWGRRRNGDYASSADSIHTLTYNYWSLVLAIFPIVFFVLYLRCFANDNPTNTFLSDEQKELLSSEDVDEDLFVSPVSTVSPLSPYTPLVEAVIAGKINLVRVLLENKATIWNQKGIGHGNSLAHVVAISDNIQGFATLAKHSRINNDEFAYRCLETVECKATPAMIDSDGQNRGEDVEQGKAFVEKSSELKPIKASKTFSDGMTWIAFRFGQQGWCPLPRP